MNLHIVDVMKRKEKKRKKTLPCEIYVFFNVICFLKGKFQFFCYFNTGNTNCEQKKIKLNKENLKQTRNNVTIPMSISIYNKILNNLQKASFYYNVKVTILNENSLCSSLI